MVSNRLERGVRATLRSPSPVTNATTVASLTAAGLPTNLTDTGATAAMKLSDVDRCI